MSLSCAIIEAGSDAFNDLKWSLVVPVFHIIFSLGVLAIWVWILVDVVSTNIGGKLEGSFLYS